MFRQVKVENLPTYLGKIDAIFPEFRVDTQIGVGDVDTYYRESFWGYALFHSWSGAIHMALSERGRFSKNDYFRQAEETEQILLQLNKRPLRVLEVGCGRGFNISYLASRCPNDKFVGVDLSMQNVRSARRALASLPNATIERGDFHSLSNFEEASFDVVLAVETLCHSHQIDAALGSISRVLTEGGKLIVYDGFRGAAAEDSDIATRAVTYTERAMAVPEFRTVASFVRSAQGADMNIDREENRSVEIMPNLVRLSDLAKSFFKVRMISNVALFLLPRGLVTNAVAGLLMAVTVQLGAHQYFRLVFTKAA